MRAIVNNIAPVRYIPIKLLSRFWRGVFWSRLVKLRYRTDWPEPQLPSPQWVKIRPILGGICGSDMAMVTLGASGTNTRRCPARARRNDRSTSSADGTG